jgi:hypothetical protein
VKEIVAVSGSVSSSSTVNGWQRLQQSRWRSRGQCRQRLRRRHPP